MSSITPNSAPPRTFDPVYLLRLWFGLKEPVGRLPYIFSGFGLMLVKYLCEAAIFASQNPRHGED